jgi:alcohol dehydrogenase class IV
VQFELATATRVLFGAGRLAALGATAHELGTRALQVRGRDAARARPVAAALAASGIAVAELAVEGEPTVDLARAGVAAAQAAGCDLVIAFGGGSVLDAGKAIAALLGNGGDPLDYLEVVGAGRPLTRPSVPFVAIPTTAGTGSEVTRNAVLASPAHRVKASLRSPHMLPRVALVDPDLLAGLPPPVVASAGLDALSQLVEPFVSSRANPITDAFAREGIRRSARALRRAFAAAPAIAAADREDLALASLLGGLCLANAGLGAVHGFAAPLGGMFEAPHGAVCAALLAPVMRANIAAAQRASAADVVARYREVAALVTGEPGARPEDGVAWVDDLRRALAIPPLAHYGMTDADVPALVAKAQTASSMKGNPLPLSAEELSAIARAAL